MLYVIITLLHLESFAFDYPRRKNVQIKCNLLLSFLGSTAQLRPWPPPKNPPEFLGGFSTIFFTG
jgi:hypothetical protein